jgi:hypothetical protein
LVACPNAHARTGHFFPFLFVIGTERLGLGVYNISASCDFSQRGFLLREAFVPLDVFPRALSFGVTIVLG